MSLALGSLLTEQAVDQLADLFTRMPDPDTLLEQAGVTRADLRALEGDDEIAAALETRREAVVTTPWRLEPYEGSPAAAWTWTEITPHVAGLIRGAWSAVPYGYSVLERIYRRAEGGRIGLARIVEKPFEWFEPRRDGALLYHPLTGGELAVDLADKFLLTRRLPTYRQPYGEALLARLYWPWYFRVNGWQFWARFLERHGAPLLVGKGKNTGQMRDALLAAVQSAVVAVDRDDSVDAVATSNAGTAFEAFTAAVDRRIQKVILGQTLTTDVSGGGGSFAAAKVHDLVRDDRRRADIALVTGTVQAVIDALCRRNFPGAEIPQFIMADDRGLEAARAERDAKLTQAGVLRLTEQYLLDRYDFEVGDFEVPTAATAPADGAAAAAPAGPQVDAKDLNAYAMGIERMAGMIAIGEGFVRGVTGLPAPAAGEPTLVPPTPAAGAAPSAGAQTARSFALAAPTSPDVPTAARFSPGQQSVEDLIVATVARAGSPIPAARLRAVVAAATGPDDLIDRLARLYGDSDRAAWTELAERAYFTADMLGFHNAETGTD